MYMFRTSYTHLQEGYIVHAALYGMSRAHPSTWMDDFLHKRMENNSYQAACK
jgi:hypothetical protein